MMSEQSAFFRSVELSDVTLRVRDLARVAGFYREEVGLSVVGETSERVALAALAVDGKAPLIVLERVAEAKERLPGTAGLFHTAFLFPGRAALGRVARRLIEREVAFGTGDHGVSEALYLDDPEGNGVELYADRAVSEWPPAGADGQVTMYTEAVDVRALLAAEAGGREGAREGAMGAGVRIGHLHLCVAGLAEAEGFFAGVLGFPVRQRSYPGALFLGRDGYHHHFGANVWRSRSPAVAGALGLARFTVNFAEKAELARVIAAAEAAGRVVRRDKSGATLRTTDGIELVVRGAAG
ncbi:VOC family protein [Nibricoccus aquaticus]|nr:VOC family protein [Nibricoccus aquaticus]